MKIVVIKIFKFCLNCVYLFFKLFKTRNQITFISRQSNQMSDDFTLLSEALKEELPDYKVVVLCKTMDNKISYAFHMLVQMYHLSRSKIVIIDSYSILVSNLKHKKSLKVIQIWHALGLMKKAGYSILDLAEGRNSKTSIALNMHKNYNYVFTTSKNCISSMSKVFGCDENIIYSVPLPRIDLLKSKRYIKSKQSTIYKKYPNLKDKKNILYAPTFRVNEDQMEIALQELIELFDFKKYNLIIKLHPLSKIKYDNEQVITAPEFSTVDMMTVSNTVISDYSSVIYEAGILGLEQIFYAFDLDNYKGSRDFFINYEKELPGPICKTAKKVIGYIKKEGYTNYQGDNLISRYVDLKVKNCTKNMVNKIKLILDDKKIN